MTTTNRGTAAPQMPAEAPTRTMRAIVQDGYGEADVLRLDTVERPAITAGQVLIKVAAAGLDRGTWHLMAGKPYAVRLAMGVRAPRNRVPGRDVAGTVVAVGDEVTSFAPGDEVFGICEGSFAEFAAASQDKLARKPAGLTFAQAAVLGISGLTALGALSGPGRTPDGQRVLIVGASGGVGSYAVQLAKAFGAEVTGVCSAGKVDLVRSLGAAHVVDYTQEDFATATQHYDLIIDIGGNSSLSRLRRVLAERGTLVMVGGEDGGSVTGMGRQFRALLMFPFLRQRLVLLIAKERSEGLQRLADLVDAGDLVPALDADYPLEQAAEAMRRLTDGRVRGKVAITMGA